ncbi:SDR family NAD(P)-dependent oxidoreductase [Nocardioides sp. Kera G14]|uniref:SDR family NAD(P)-dependent oxidoreductase n=1 Tax=Nocardioides sp. Kera G14 TaxID=2884264 RepID=UPI001D109DC9|nr:SDR family NAD(P)-dependent oxidoreductase [Nocardioides sp. Kera G14]UDY24896.1 SDR family NAD(P)-dependent oxidoreductase [Nocardioides sp. Kera G14]
MTTIEQGQVAVVTGASSGIGRALAAELVTHGYEVVIAADEPEITAVAAELSATYAGSTGTALPVQVDLAESEGVTRLYEAVRKRGVPKVAMLNVGVGVGGRFDQTELVDDLRLIDLNVRSTVHLAKLVLHDMVAAGEGRILVTSSIAAVAPGPYYATYAASKAFVHSFAEGIREELKDTGVTVTSLMPGPTDTEFFIRAHMEDTPVGQGTKDDPADVAKDGFKALMAGKASVVAGSLKNRFQAEAGTHMPDALMSPLMARMTKPEE